MGRARRQLAPAAAAAELPPDISPALLKALHILTRDGALNADSRRKLKQVTHLLGLLAPSVTEALERAPEPVVVDCGAGKGYLGFLLASRFLQPAGRGRVVNVESRAELCERAGAVAREAGLADRVAFLAGDVASAPLPERVHVLTALHACDTATDDALFAAISRGVDHVAVVPCCQAEVARQLAEARSPGTMRLLHEHPLHRREFGAHLTNVVRTLALRATGYQVTVTELVGWEHSMKNELILARRVHREDPRSRDALATLLRETGVAPSLVVRLRDAGLLPPPA